MKQVENWWLLSLFVVVVALVTMAEQVTSQTTKNRNSTLMRCYCSLYHGSSPEYFKSNLNTTLSRLRRQLTTSGYAVARTLFNGESVWGLASCRGYVSIPDCLDCFDFAVNQLKVCGLGNGGHAFYNDCDLRYDNQNFYDQAYDRTGVVICGNTTSRQPTQFRKAAKRLLLDLQFAAPRTMNFYAASMSKVDVDNETLYAIAQCNLNVSQSVCLQCLKSRYRSLYNCLPATSGRSVDNGCFMRYDRTPFFGQNQTTDITSLLWDEDSTKRRYIIVVTGGGVSFFLLVLALFVWFRRWKERGRGQQVSVKGIVCYNYKHLQLATDNFSDDNIIGKGGFGEVFKANLDDKDVVAVKKLKVGYAKAGFENEILLISQIRHRNLLGLQGWSSDGSNLLLVMEYIENGSLDRFLWGDKCGTLNWRRRYDIILGIARGLAHLHKEFHVRIVHRDIKSCNILLDEDFQPKIADFGLARFHPEDQSHVTTKFAGTLGYTAPEYVLYGILSDKVDIFSFGVVILEVISGRKCSYRNFDESSNNCLLEYAWSLYETNSLMKLVDDTMDVNQEEEKNMMKIIEIALLCTQSPASKRPTMSEVVLMLLVDSSLEERQLTKPNFMHHNRRLQVGG